MTIPNSRCILVNESRYLHFKKGRETVNDVFKVIKQDMRTGGITTFHFKDVDGGTEVRIEHQDGRIEFEFHPTPKHHSELVAELL